MCSEITTNHYTRLPTVIRQRLTMAQSKLKESYDPNWIPVSTSSEFKAKKILEDHGFSVIHNQRLYGYYPDLRIAGTNVLIEIDGGYHDRHNQKCKDAQRTKILGQYGFIVLRFTNSQVNQEDLLINKVRESIGIRPTKKVEILGIVSSPSDLKKMIEAKMKANTVFLIGRKESKAKKRHDRIDDRKSEKSNLKAENAKLRKEIAELKKQSLA